MFAVIRAHQLNIMLFLSAACITIALLLFITRFISNRSRWILIAMEFVAAFLLAFDRLAYSYSGVLSHKGYVMVRLANFMVFFLTPGIVFCFNLYIMDMIAAKSEGTSYPRRLLVVNVLSIIGMFMAVVSAFTNLYYYFDDHNRYQRGPGFLIAYIVPVICPLILFTAVRSYKEKFGRFTYTALILYIFVPLIMGIVQIFTYGLSITNMSLVIVSILMYIFTYLDINDEVVRVHSAQMQHLEEGKKSMENLFDQTARVFMSALDDRNEYTRGHSLRVADYAKRLAAEAGLDKKECDAAYYAALLHGIGRINVPPELTSKNDALSDEEKELIKEIPEKSSRMLAQISEHMDLSKAVRYCKEKYDGSGYPEGLKGEEIPKISRIVYIADAYDNMTSKNSYRDPLPQPIVREELIKEAGASFDPVYAKFMRRIVDSDYEYRMREEGTMEDVGISEELKCGEYRDNTLKGIKIDTFKTILQFMFRPDEKEEGKFSAPAIILFDSYNGAVHNTARTIKDYGYKEYAELWFDGHYNCTAAQNVEVTIEDMDDDRPDGLYEVIAFRNEDHLKLTMTGNNKRMEAVVALANGTTWAYIGLTGENCLLSDIKVTEFKEEEPEEEITRIADRINYIDRLESDLPNIQIDGTRTLSTQGIPVTDGMRLRFHTMTLPMAIHVWHCPYIVLFYSEDGLVNGPGYTEYAMIKLNGEDNGSKDYVQNSFTMKKTDDFGGWDTWMEKNMAGLECVIDFVRKGKKITLSTKNLGIDIVNTSVITDNPSQIYVSLTGDEVALTDIRIEQ